MKLFDILADRFGNRKKELNSSKKKTWKPWDSFPEENYPISVLNEAPPKWNEEDYLKEARGWVGACVSVIADEIASTDLRLYQVNKSGKVEELYEHEILDTLYKVNNFTTKFDHFWLTQQYLELVGEAPWFIEYENTGGTDESGEEYIEDAKMKNKRIKSIHLLRPDKITIKFNNDGDNDQVISGYDYEVSSNKKVHLKPSEVIFLKYPNPYRPLRGMGTLESVAQTVDLDNYAEKWNLNFFYNSARPDMILSTEGNLNEQQMERMKEQWNKNFRGTGNAFKMAILEGGLKADKIQPTQKDMDFLEQMRFSRDKIMSIFRVPKTALGLTEDVNRCYSEDTEVLTERGFKKYNKVVENEKIATVNPDNNKIEYHLPNEKFVYDYEGEMIEIKNRNNSILVTPNHRMWRRTERGNEYDIVEAKDLEKHIRLVASFDYNNKDLQKVIIPSIERKNGSNKKTQNQKIKVNADDLIEYIGYFLSEGGLLKEISPNFRYIHTISQKEGIKADKIRKCIKKLPFSIYEYTGKDNIIIWNVYGKALNHWLRENFGDGCDNKKIPKYFKNLSKRQLKILFDALMLGDGSWDKRKNRSSGYYSTTSKKLVDDIQEIAIKLGYSASVATHYEENNNKKVCYVVHLSDRKEHRLRNGQRTINYSGKVWCFDVPNHIFITRRDGKITAQGNSNAEATDYVFAKRTVKPKMRRIVDQLNEFLVPLYGENLFLDFVNPVPEDYELKLKEYEKALQYGWMSVNEVREKEGLPPVQNGDAPTIPGNVIPLGEPKKGNKSISLGKPIKEKKQEMEDKKNKENMIPYRARVRSRVKNKQEVKEELKKIIKMHLKHKKNGDYKTKKGSANGQKRSIKNSKKRTNKK